MSSTSSNRPDRPLARGADHLSAYALIALRWLDSHEVTIDHLRLFNGNTIHAFVVRDYLRLDRRKTAGHGSQRVLTTDLARTAIAAYVHGTIGFIRTGDRNLSSRITRALTRKMKAHGLEIVASRRAA